MNNLEKFFCPHCGVENDFDISGLLFLEAEDAKEIIRKETCWYCNKTFSWLIRSENYE